MPNNILFFIVDLTLRRRGITLVQMVASWLHWISSQRSLTRYWGSWRNGPTQWSKPHPLSYSNTLKSLFSYMILDTPGQIEIFTWSASGAIITDAVASSFPTVVAYIIDTPRTAAPATFMSNMLYACSILYKTKLPFILVFNKTDVISPEPMLEWMRDFEAFQRALASDSHRDADGEAPYMNSLMNSMSLVLEEFYKELKVGCQVQVLLIILVYTFLGCSCVLIYRCRHFRVLWSSGSCQGAIWKVCFMRVILCFPVPNHLEASICQN